MPQRTSLLDALGLALACALAVALRAWVLLAFPEMELTGDERHFYLSGVALSQGEPGPYFPFRPPLYPFVCGILMRWFGESVATIQWFQVGLEGFTTLGVGLLARGCIDRRVGTIAALLYALHPDFIAYSHYLWSESVYLFLLVFALLALVSLAEEPSWAVGLMNGLFWGALALVKPFHFYILPFLLLALVVRAETPDRRALSTASAVAWVVALLAVVPWSWQMSRTYEQPILISTNGAVALRIGNRPKPPPQFDFPARLAEEPKDVDPGARRDGWHRFVLAHPQLFLERAVEKQSYLWGPNSYLQRHLYRGIKYGPPRKLADGARRAVVYGGIALTALLWVGFALGFPLLRHRGLSATLGTYTAAIACMISLSVSVSRYRLPLLVFAIWGSCQLFASLPELPRSLRRPGVLLGSAAALAFLAWMWWLRAPELFAALY